MEDFKIVDFGCKVNETQSLTRKNSEISSSCERDILLFDICCIFVDTAKN